MPKLVSRREAAKALKVMPGQVSRWVADGAPVIKGAARGHPDRFDVEALRNWREGRAAATGAKHVSLEQERARLARASAERVEMLNKRQRGELLARSVYEQELTPVLLAFRTKMLAAPRSWAPAVTRAAAEGVVAVERELTAHVRELLGVLSTLPQGEEK